MWGGDAASAHRSEGERVAFLKKSSAKNFIVAIAHALRRQKRKRRYLATALICALTECSFSAPKGAPSSRAPYPGGSVVVSVSLAAQRIGHEGKLTCGADASLCAARCSANENRSGIPRGAGAVATLCAKMEGGEVSVVAEADAVFGKRKSKRHHARGGGDASLAPKIEGG